MCVKERTRYIRFKRSSPLIIDPFIGAPGPVDPNPAGNSYCTLIEEPVSSELLIADDVIEFIGFCKG